MFPTTLFVGILVVLMMAYFDAPKLFHPLFAIWIYQCALSLLTLEGMEPKISTLMKTVS